MAKPMRYREVAKALAGHGCISRRGRGDHEKWYCPCGEHVAVVTRPGRVSAGVVADTIKKMKCLPEGWLQ